MARKTDNRHAIFSYLNEVKQSLDTLDVEAIYTAATILLNAYIRGKTVFTIGNGGSASTASHMACDLSKGTLKRVYDGSERRLRVISLTDNVALLTAYANDLSYPDIFTQQLRNLVSQGDVVIVISGSGNSENVVRAVKYAKKCKAYTIGLLGFSTGGMLGKLVDLPIIVKNNKYGPCEDVHLILNHVITSFFSKLKHEHDFKKVHATR